MPIKATFNFIIEPQEGTPHVTCELRVIQVEIYEHYIYDMTLYDDGLQESLDIVAAEDNK